jgi:hypothetical protein
MLVAYQFESRVSQEIKSQAEQRYSFGHKSDRDRRRYPYGNDSSGFLVRKWTPTRNAIDGARLSRPSTHVTIMAWDAPITRASKGTI